MEELLSDRSKIEAACKIIDEADIILVGVGSELTSPRCDSQEVEEFYNNISSLINGRNYYIITINTDGIVRKCGFDDSHIVEPCGTISKLQCEEACTKDIYTASDYEEKDLICPKCGKKLIPNTVDSNNYVEEGYLADWKNYTLWISSTLNKKLCVLECGVKLEYPGIIRWPFEKIVSINNKARLIRINNSLPQLSDSVRDKGISIKGSPCVILRELARQ